MDVTSKVGNMEGVITVGGVPIESSLGVLEGNSLELGTRVGLDVTNGVGSGLGNKLGNSLTEGREVGTGPEMGELVVGVWLHVGPLASLGAVLGEELNDGPRVGMDDSSKVGNMEGDTTAGGVPIESSLGVLEGKSLELGKRVGVDVIGSRLGAELGNSLSEGWDVGVGLDTGDPSLGVLDGNSLELGRGVGVDITDGVGS
jgi:hypothetical protein